MDTIIINGGKPISGDIRISGSKNSALPILAASILCTQEVCISNVPDLWDIAAMNALLIQLGATVNITGRSSIEDGSANRSVIIDARSINNMVAPYELVKKMRASVLVLGPLLGKFGKAKVSLPGGCAIGTRPIDMHIKAIEAMGAHVELDGGYIIAETNGKLRGAEIFFEKVSVGATENTLMAAALAEGITTIHNAAREPEIVDLANFLNAAGAKISGAGTDTITIDGVEKLGHVSHRVICDRIEAGTYAAAALITKGNLRLHGISPELLRSCLLHLKEIGAIISERDDGITISAGDTLARTNIRTDPYPNFATDLQAQMMAVLSIADGQSIIRESIFENRFMHVSELNRMGARIHIEDHIAIVDGVKELQAAEVMATDLRASVALILAALSAKGESLVGRIYHLYRGYEQLDRKLRSCGADIRIMGL